ncbi:hypothetical protein CEB41_07375 [Lactiplantibacillus plantarum]|uniref:exodeoxyribonuclease X C-terminal domain-containing protein n=1 Tax=Lactiplantibacillus plantarum TaxID=1590 RepID=UPI000E09D5A7|nr:hypothetical protein [Lactiplantibacillus plantarum]AXH04297.1 hypothetical protein CEB41_07375 [Lactiplantibacillus plantarum]
MSEAIAKAENQTNSLSLIMGTDQNKMASELQAISNFQTMVQKQLKNGQDFGVVPGTQKPTLLKPGAEKIQMLMGVTSEYNVIDKVENYKDGYFDYTVKCVLYKSGMQLTEGLGSTNTKESKYVSRDGFSMKNTVLKMAKKRAQVDATLTIASLSNVFTQDVEDMQNFNQRENNETMTYDEAFNLKLNFGKNKGKSMGDVMNENRGYIEWLAENAQKPEFKTAAKLLLTGKQQPETDDKAHEDFDPTNIIASSKQTSEIANLAGELATQTKNGTPLSVTNEVIQQIVPDWKGTDDDWKNLTIAQAEDAKSQLQGLLAAFDKK